MTLKKAKPVIVKTDIGSMRLPKIKTASWMSCTCAMPNWDLVRGSERLPTQLAVRDYAEIPAAARADARKLRTELI